MPSGTKELFLSAQKGDKQALDTLVCDNLRLAHSIARRFRGRGTEDDDLCQIGAIGLIKAIYGFNPELDIAFSTYAVPTIMGEIRRYLRDNNIIKTSRRLREISVKASFLREELSYSLHREPTVSEIAMRLGITPEEVASAAEAALAPVSFDKALDTDRAQTLADRLPSDSDISEEAVNRIAVYTLLEESEPVMRQIIYYRYFEDKKQSEIAQIMGLSQVQVSRLEKRAIESMRKRM